MKYQIVPFEEKFLCCIISEDGASSTVFEAERYDQVFAWLRLMVGDYPGTQLAA